MRSVQQPSPAQAITQGFGFSSDISGSFSSTTSPAADPLDAVPETETQAEIDGLSTPSFDSADSFQIRPLLDVHHPASTSTSTPAAAFFRNASAHTPQDKAQLRCEICKPSKPYDCARKLRKHLRQVHDKKHKCHALGCNFAFGLRLDLERHQSSAHSKHKAKHFCNVEACTASFPRRDNLLRHRRNVHRIEQHKAESLPDTPRLPHPTLSTLHHSSVFESNELAVPDRLCIQAISSPVQDHEHMH